ncbi:succinoglycan biosynthesis protein ExoH [Rhizobium cellulosilyticum]|uniref:Succinoglycan biosynthesis protein ExoH n=1 Tax=Aliirhizobium cellulosilyticum TaxID=393664 RepID=A0A7W6TED2_9HYPH|nr:acyltransferase [Rhizobium cellulosilyticum]MBB4346478.1 succinoglycan biosynthesis protein ExoH [Rhizobium cellulosilyticum]MBB4411128.1 succinoglycan biosynthesis protein ExoH [Rhizobium cellulosilyticum]MBB4445817.1 succinoglycan biosynthesis protein ExoH [Rhizobium cellulosilyticum]
MTVDQNISSRINLMRILLICGIVFVHVPHDPAADVVIAETGWFNWLSVFLGDSLFRIGVPCLSMISGYLLLRKGAASFDYGKVVRSKAMTVLVPFLIWNLGLFLAILGLQRVGIGVGYFPDITASFRDVLTYAFALEDLPANVPLYFLRDLFVCILLSPVLLFLLRRAAIPTLAILFVLAVIPDLSFAIVIKRSILFSFALGMFLGLRAADLKALDRFAWPGSIATLLAAFALSLAIFLSQPAYPWGVDLARNILSIVGAFGVWMISALAIETRIGKRLAATGSLSFWIFCAHYPVLVLLWMVWNRVGSPEAYPIFYFGSVVVSLVILVISNAVIMRIVPPVYQLLTGSRGRKEKLAKATSNRPVGSSHPMEPKLSQQRR